MSYTCNEYSCNIQNFETNLDDIFQKYYKNHITYITIENSSLDRFPPFIFEEMPNLREIRLTNIGLKILDTNVFGGHTYSKLSTVRTLHLTENELISIGPGLFSKIDKLHYMFLNNNKISEIVEHAFDELEYLSLLNLDYNLLSFLNINTFSKLLSLTVLTLSHNQFKIFNMDIFVQNVNLIKVDLSFNKLGRIQSLHTNWNFTDLNLSANDLSDISALDKMKKVTKLYLDDNKNLMLNSKFFINMPQLEHLEMKSVNLNKLNNDYSLFVPLQKLKILNITSNDLQSINELPNLQNLRELWVDDNKLRYIDVDRIKEQCPKLSGLFIGIKNNWNCVYLKSLLDKLNSYDLDFKITFDTPLASSAVQVSGAEFSNNQAIVSLPDNQEISKQPETSSLPTNQEISNKSETSQIGQCGTITLIKSFIFGGSQSKRGMWPWLVAVYHGRSETKKFICAGSLLNEKIVLSAAHCIQDDPTGHRKRAKDIQLHIGHYDLKNQFESDYEVSNVKNIIVHPDWLEGSDSSFDADLVLLVLEQPTRYGININPVCLWQGSDDINDIVNKTGTVVGWGQQQNGKTSNVPWMADIKVISEVTCLRADDPFRILTSARTFCGITNDESGPCSGDSGGGFYMKRGQQWMLRGIVSGSLINDIKMCNLKKPVVYTDVAKFLEWINHNVNYYSNSRD